MKQGEAVWSPSGYGAPDPTPARHPHRTVRRAFPACPGSAGPGQHRGASRRYTTLGQTAAYPTALLPYSVPDRVVEAMDVGAG